jgi:hypothetical protein
MAILSVGNESCCRVHYYIWYISLILFFIFLYYIFFYNKKIEIKNDKDWISLFPKEIINDISHDEMYWYWKGKNTCVGYGDVNELCKRNEMVCSNINLQNSMGTREQQAYEVINSIKNGGTSKKCPLL